MSTEQQSVPTERKPSIFTCKNCKTAEIKTERKPKEKSEATIVKLEPAKSSNMDKKYIVKVNGKTVSFGARSYSDFTINKSEDRKQAYIGRHEKRESQFWSFDDKLNLLTASFWARYLLWEKPDIFEAIAEIEKNTGLQIKYTKNTIQKHQNKLAKAVKKSGEDLD
jgi:hypothetical protein